MSFLIEFYPSLEKSCRSTIWLIFRPVNWLSLLIIDQNHLNQNKLFFCTRQFKEILLGLHLLIATTLSYNTRYRIEGRVEGKKEVRGVGRERAAERVKEELESQNVF